MDDGMPLNAKGEHYFSSKQTSKERQRTIGLFINGKNLRFKTSSGMFSPKKVDNATVLLIENMRPGKRVLDLGCGYGPIGIAAASLNPRGSVTMAEINERAAKLAMENVMMNNIPNALVVRSDFFEKLGEERYDTILMNPPMAIGLKRIFDLIAECREHLSKGGSLQIVARHGKGGGRLEDKMKEVFGNVEEIAKGGGFRVYMSILSK
jgi:16S rRNA (guanine1207-N2)-methyltransferase